MITLSGYEASLDELDEAGCIKKTVARGAL